MNTALRFLLGAVVVLICSTDCRASDPVPLNRAPDRARVVDGDTLAIGYQRVRIAGIDAPETHQTCDNGSYAAGTAAAEHMRRLINSLPVSCTGTEYDRYGRLIGHCGTREIPDLGRAMVADGMAWAFVRYSNEYVPEQQTARRARKGVHDHECIVPWLWRRQ
jgi:endonuclease YncB( thermonuclease family)